MQAKSLLASPAVQHLAKRPSLHSVEEWRPLVAVWSAAFLSLGWALCPSESSAFLSPITNMENIIQSIPSSERMQSVERGWGLQG